MEGAVFPCALFLFSVEEIQERRRRRLDSGRMSAASRSTAIKASAAEETGLSERRR